MFQHGRKHYADGIHNLRDADLREIWNMYRRKYWGVVDGETWEANNKSSETMESRGEIKAKYVTENGDEVFIFRMADCSYALFATQRDIDNGFVDGIRQQRAGREQRGRLSVDEIRRSMRLGS